MRSLSLRLAGVFLMAALPVAASAATTAYGPSAYLQTGDTPAAFICAGCILEIEDFEDNALDSFLSIDNGEILAPNSFSGLMNSVTDSVDGDDGVVDGNGNGGHSWFTGASNSADMAVTITFADPVKAAGLVFTDGDSASTDIMLEAFDSMGTSLGIINAGDLADGTFTGETAEDSFLGFTDMNSAIKSITLSQNAGVGIEIDHIHWQHSCVVPEPATMGMVMMSLLGIVGFRRRRR